jgi:hypothetical protein
MKAAQNYRLSLEEMKKYTGQYVAVMDGRVVASGRDLYRKVEELEKKNPDKEIVITYIPTEDLLIL